MTMTPPRPALVAALAFLAACESLGLVDCTLIGCESGLQVGFPTVPTGAYRVEVQAAGSAEVLVVGCESLGLVDCTLIGCESGLRVDFQTAPTGAYRVEVQAAGASEVLAFDCADPARCRPGAFFRDFTAPAATITVTTARGTVRRAVQLSYVTSRPNGEGCPPVCRQASVTVSLPA